MGWGQLCFYCFYFKYLFIYPSIYLFIHLILFSNIDIVIVGFQNYTKLCLYQQNKTKKKQLNFMHKSRVHCIHEFYNNTYTVHVPT